MREKWLTVTGTIVESADSPPGATGPTFLPDADVHAYVIDVAVPKSQLQRTCVSTFSRFVHEVGAPMHVRVSTKTGEITVDHDAMTQVAVQLMKDHPEARPNHVRSGQPVRPGPAPQGVTPAVASPPGPVGSAPGPVGSAFDTTGGAGTADERIARLRELLDKGILTESEFQAKRQQVLGQA